MQRRPLIIANWKAYIEDIEEAKAWVAKISRAKHSAEVWAAVPTTFVSLFAKSKMPVGVQALSRHSVGPHTGEVTAVMAAEAGATFALVGHSERRAAGDDNSAVQAQLAGALKAGLVPVLCVGELERTQDGAHFGVIEEQLRTAFAGAQSLAKRVVVAYEPVWAIGKSAEHAMKPADIQETTIFIRKVLAEILSRPQALKVPILYGGAAEAANAAHLVREGGVSGLLVGHRSVMPNDFLSLLTSLDKSRDE